MALRSCLTPPLTSDPGLTVIILEPILEIVARMLSFEPSPIANIAITEATPIIIPNMVSKVLVLLRTMALKAILIKFNSLIINRLV